MKILPFRQAQRFVCGEVLKGLDFHHRRSSTCGKGFDGYPCLKGRIFITAGKRQRSLRGTRLPATAA
jgi:hypothetical protein